MDANELQTSMAAYAVPLENRKPLLMWIINGVEPGDFLQAVLVNDLRCAVNAASRNSMGGLAETVRWLEHQAPGRCWGSDVAYHNWMCAGGWNGLDPNEQKLALWR